MAPAARCEGCGEGWRTAHEPASNDEMAALLNETAEHKAKVEHEIGISVMESLVVSIGGEPTRKKSHVHRVRFAFFEKTPTEGFENAKIVEAP